MSETNIMTTAFDQLHRQLLGFDFRTLSQASAQDGFPHYNLRKFHEDDEHDTYLIELALAGYQSSEIEISELDGNLVIRGNPIYDGPPEPHFDDDPEARREAVKKYQEYISSQLHTGISRKAFTRTFKLAPGVDIDSVNLNNGILTVKLVQKLPPKPQRRVFSIEAPQEQIAISA